MGPRRADSPKGREACLSRRVELLGGLGERPVPRAQPLSELAGCGMGLVAHARREPSALLWGLGRALTGGSLNAPGPGGGNVFEKPVSPFSSRGGFRRLLKDVEQRYSDAFAEVGPGTLQDFKNLIDCVDGFFDLLADPKTDFRVKLMDYAKVEADVAEFCRYYARWLGDPLAERLKHESTKF